VDPKRAASEELLTAIRNVARGGSYADPSLGAALATGNAPRSPEGGVGLSPSEQEVLVLIADGHTNEEISKIIGSSRRTVEAHRSRIGQKLGVRTREALVRYSRQAGLAGPSWRTRGRPTPDP